MLFTRFARRLGFVSAVATVVLLVAYAVTLAIGLSTLASPDQPIGDPIFSILEILIVAMMPSIVTLMVALHAWATARSKALGFAAVVFIGLLAGVTCSSHFVILTVSHRPPFAGQPWLPLILTFKWPSTSYALDILAWNVFFPISMLLAAPAVSGSLLAFMDTVANDRVGRAGVRRAEWRCLG